MAPPRSIALLIAAGVAAGCAERLHMMDTGGEGFSTGYLFWPPPRATSSWTAPSPSVEVATLGEAQAVVAQLLHGAGYEDERWLAIGARGEHGIAATTRMERIDVDGRAAPDRWLPQYPSAPSLQWLGVAATPYLPKRGRYRVFLVALTDLVVRAPGQPIHWDETTAMEGPGPSGAPIPPSRPVPRGARLGVWVYEFEGGAGEKKGEFVTDDDRFSAADHIARAGLAALTHR